MKTKMDFNKLAFIAYVLFAIVAILFGFMIDFDIWLEYTDQVIAVLTVLGLSFIAFRVLAEAKHDLEIKKLKNDFRRFCIENEIKTK